MNNERKPNRKSLRQVLLSAISLTLIFSIFNLGGGLRVFAETSLKKNFTGEQVFRGVLFGEGEVAELFPEIWKNGEAERSPKNEEEAKAWNSIKEKIILEAQANDPDFMDRFGQEMQSGDHLRIQATLEESGTKIKTAMQKLGMMNEKGEMTQAFKTNMCCSAVLVCAEAIAVAIAVALVVVIAVVLLVVITRDKFSPEEQNTSRLYRERLINSIAEKLNATE